MLEIGLWGNEALEFHEFYTAVVWMKSVNIWKCEKVKSNEENSIIAAYGKFKRGVTSCQPIFSPSLTP